METFNILEELNEDQLKDLHSYCYQMIYEIFELETRDDEFNRIDLALKQTFVNSTNTDEFTAEKILEGANKEDIELAADVIDQEDEEDEFSSLYMPTIYGQWKGWVSNLKEASIPDTNDWYSVERENSKLLNSIGLRDFLPILNRCEERNMYLENKIFKIKGKLSKAVAQFAAYGGTPAIPFYNAIDAYVDIKVPHLRDYGIYPIHDEWYKSNNVYRYDINFAEAVASEELNQELLRQFKPWSNLDESQQDYAVTPTDRSAEFDDYEAPFGKIRFHKIYIDSLYLEDKTGQGGDVIMKGVLLTVAYQPLFKANVDNTIVEKYSHGNSVYILEAYKNITEREYRPLFGKFDDTLPGMSVGKGPLIPFLVFQEIQNQLISAMARETDRVSDPPLNFKAGDNDLDEVDRPPLRGGSEYVGIEADPVVVPGYENRILSIKEVLKYLASQVEENSGMTKLQMGGRPQSRRTKFELQEQLDAGGLRVNDAAGLFDEFLEDVMRARNFQTKFQLRKQIETAVEMIMEASPLLELSLNREQAMEIALEENVLFQRLLVFYDLEAKYQDFYEGQVKKYDENELLLAQFQRTGMELNMVQEQLSAPMQEFQEPLSQNFDQSSVENAREEFYAIQKNTRDNLIARQDSLLQEMNRLKLMIVDMPEPVPPSNTLYYLMISDEINQSDIVVHGAKTSLNKAMVRRAALELFEVVTKLDPNSKLAREIDPGKILKPYMAAMDMSFEDIKKPESDIRKEEEQIRAAQAQAMQQQQQEQVQE